MLDVETQIKNILIIHDEARKLECTEVELIWAEDIVFDSRVNLKCRQNLCSHYGKNFMCPPFVPSCEEFKRHTTGYKFALLLQCEETVKPDLVDREKEELYKSAALFVLNALILLEKMAFKLGFHFSIGLGSGDCKLCEICRAKMGGHYCNRPGEARPSMEAVGIDVMSTCARAGLKNSFTDEKVCAVGLLLIT